MKRKEKGAVLLYVLVIVMVMAALLAMSLSFLAIFSSRTGTFDSQVRDAIAGISSSIEEASSGL